MICNKCKVDYPDGEGFYISKNNVISKPCKACRRKKALDRVENIGREEINARNRVLAKKRYVKKHGLSVKMPLWAKMIRKSIKKTHPDANIDTKYILELYGRQRGKCYFTGIDMEVDDFYSKPAVEMIEYKYGYLKTNVVLCCSMIKIARGGKCLVEFKRFVKRVGKNFSMVKKII